jgi:hypothetical protein
LEHDQQHTDDAVSSTERGPVGARAEFAPAAAIGPIYLLIPVHTGSRVCGRLPGNYWSSNTSRDCCLMSNFPFGGYSPGWNPISTLDAAKRSKASLPPTPQRI